MSGFLKAAESNFWFRCYRTPNTRYLERAVAALRHTETVPDSLLAHLSPLGWEHVNLTGDYVWGAPQTMSENSAGLRPLRTPNETYDRAA